MESLFDLTPALFNWIYVGGGRRVRHKDNTMLCPESCTIIDYRFVTMSCISIFYKQRLNRGAKSVCNKSKGF
jgi:hypothetical protein